MTFSGRAATEDGAGAAYIDPDHVLAALGNIIDNGNKVLKLKKVLNAKITTAVDQNREKNELVLTISDNGPGIPEELLETNEDGIPVIFAKGISGTGSTVFELYIALRVISEADVSVTVEKAIRPPNSEPSLAKGRSG